MRIQIPEEKTFVHESIIPIRWGDMDAFGHVNNAVYFRYIEQARINWLESLGLSFTQDEQGVVVVNAFCNYMKPVEYPADLIIKTYIANPTRVGLDTFNVMSLVGDPETIRATSGATIVWVDFKTQKAASWPAEIKAKLGL
jgi:acyl-CoA thioester hydrolase